MLHFAYDGSLNGDWVAHYGIRLAAHHPEHALRVLHVREDKPLDLDAHLARLRVECEHFQVRLLVDEVRATRVADAIIDAVPTGDGELLLCGTRLRPRNRLYLSGTVSERLLQKARVRTLCVRVVQPGLLGQPGRILLPFAGHPRGASAVLPLLELFDGDVSRLHILLVVDEFSPEATGYIARVEHELQAGLADWAPQLDSHVVAGRDIAHEIVVNAGKRRCALVLLGASERTLPERVLHGSPIERVLRASPADVAIYKQP